MPQSTRDARARMSSSRLLGALLVLVALLLAAGWILGAVATWMVLVASALGTSLVVLALRHAFAGGPRGADEALRASEHERSEEECAALLDSERAARSLAEREARLKDEFVATVSHELRTPLNAILGWAEMLKKGTLDAAAQARAIDVIVRNARAQAQLVDDLLDASRILSGKLRLDVKPVNLAALVDHAVASAAPAAEAKSVWLECTQEYGSCPVEGDPGRLAQVIDNLLSNAIKFTPRGGRVAMRLRCTCGHAEITVRDTGKGISADFLPHVFERFRQADGSTTRSHGGLGLGLGLAKYLVEQHGGEIRAESEGEGRGATFTVRLPTAASCASTCRAPTPIDAGRSLAGVKVLVVDDEPDALALVDRILSDCGAEVVTAGSATEALEALPALMPDVLVSDISMPGHDGYHLVRAVRALRPDRGGATPAVALTAFSRPEDRERALGAGYQVHVSKPFDQAELVLAVATAGDRVA